MNETPQDHSDGEALPTDAAPQGALARFIEYVGDRLNPILVKETRQALKSRQFTLWFVLLLIACWVTTIGAVAVIGPSIFYVSAGGYLLYVYYVILALPLAVVVPFSAYRSLASEHEENTRDLLEVSSLSPRQVINGKLGSATLQIVIYLSALAPCLAFTYLLRGVELGAIFLLLAYAVLASIGLSALGLVVAAITRQKYAQVVMSVTLAGGLFGAFSGLIAAASGLLGMDSGDFHRSWFWWTNLAVLSLFLTTFGIVYAAAISLTTFTSANRSTALRWAAFIQQGVFVAWVAGVIAAGDHPNVLFVAITVAAIYWFGVGALMTGEAPSLSLRVRRSLPQSLIGRALFTWFNPGSGSGYLFAVTNLATLALMAAVAIQGYGVLPGMSAPSQSVKAIGLLAAYFVAYLGLGRLVIVGLRRVTQVTLLGAFLVQVLLVLGGSALPFVVKTMSERTRVADIPTLNYSSPTWNLPRVLGSDLSDAAELGLLVTVGAVSLAVFVVNLAMAGREARLLRVATPRRVLEDERELHPGPEARPTNPWGDRSEAAADTLT